jgi:uracil-DNA glycosylase family 4
MSMTPENSTVAPEYFFCDKCAESENLVRIEQNKKTVSNMGVCRRNAQSAIDEMTTVPNHFPTLSSHLRIALVGEAPGGDEVKKGEPFVGPSGRFLSALLARAGTSREACFVGNVCQHQPPGNEIAAFEWDGPEIQFGIEQLYKDLGVFKPNITVCLGGTPLHLFKLGFMEKPRKAKQKGRFVFKWPHPPTVWRGSLFNSCVGTKCLSTLHPAYCLPNRCPEDAPLLQFDLRKAVREGGSPILRLPERKFTLDSSASSLCALMNQIEESPQPIAIDIEGYVGAMSCVSIAHSKTEAFIVPFFRKDGSNCFNLTDETKVWRSFASLMENPNVPKILQNSLYDRFVLHYSYGIRVRGVVDDTMLKWWELYAELEKALSVQASICTDEPYYKGDRKTQDDKTFFDYCCKDSAVTYEINSVLAPRVSGTSLSHYRLNIALLNPLLYMEMRGISYNSGGAVIRRDNVRSKMFEEQALLNGLTGRFLKTRRELNERALEVFHFKKAFIDDVGTDNNVRKPQEENAHRFQTLLHQPSPSLSVLGEIEDLLKVSLNVDSKTKFQDYLYNHLQLPIQYDDKKEEPTPTTDYEALLKLTKYAEKEQPSVAPILRHCIEIRSLDTHQEMLGISADQDGRVRCGYNLVGSDTGRITCYTSPTGSGYNLQTIPKSDRDLFRADEDHWLFQCDLAGADGWTVAAYCAMLGDNTMLDDYLFGLKPAKILVLQLRGFKVDYSNRAALKEASEDVSSESWDYFGMKRVQHGCSYLEGPRRVSNQILSDSEGKLVLEESECKKLRDQFFFKRYPGIQRWHNWVTNKISERPTLIAASGQVRHFFGHNEKMLPKAVAFEPQANTTYATNLAMYKLWTDKENRTTEADARMVRPRVIESDGGGQENPNGKGNGHEQLIRLRVEPLHQVHDALIGQFKKADTAWSVGKINTWFNNPLFIGGQKITIPFEGGYGDSWGQAGDEKKRVGKI